MTKKYQRTTFDTSVLAVPEQVSVAMNENAADMQEGLLALAVGAGLQVMQQLMEADVTAACGPRGRHDRDRTATRHGTGGGSVTLGGRRVPISRPRVRAVDGSGELPVPADELSPPPSCWAGWRWSGCWLGCRPAASRSPWNRSGRLSRTRRKPPASRRCRGSSWR